MTQAGACLGWVRGATHFMSISRCRDRGPDPAGFCGRLPGRWTSGAGDLPCPGEANDSRGFVRRIDKPTLENGYAEEEPALLTNPQMITDGLIRGKYPSVTVGLSDHFAAIIGCAYKADACDVIFQLDYQIGDGSIQNLAAWREIYDGQFDLVDVDLSGLAGQDVNFILTVLSNGSASQDRALWLAPHIVRK